MKKLLTICFLVISGNSFSQDHISLDLYREAVMAYSYDLKIDELSEFSAEERRQILKKGFLPSISASGDFSLNFRDEMATIGGVSNKLQPYSFSLQPQIIQTIYGGSSVRNNYKRGQIELEMSRLSRAYTVLEVAYAAEYSYWNLVANRAYLDASIQYIKIIKDLRKIIQYRFDDGYIGKSDLLMTDVRLGEAEYSLLSVQKNYDSALSNFNTLMGLSPTTPHDVSDDTASSSSSHQRIGLDSVLSSRPDYLSATQLITYESYGIKTARSPYNPQLVGGVSGLWRSSTPNVNGSTNLDGYMFVRLTVPIFSWGVRRNSVNIARNRHSATLYQRNQLVDKIANDENLAWITIDRSSQQVDKSAYNLRLGKENLDLNTYSYNEGQVPILEVLSAQLSWLQLYTNAITASYNYNVSMSQYRKVVGSFPN